GSVDLSRATVLLHFFFSSRRRHTRFSRDWSSDVCSSDLGAEEAYNALMTRWHPNCDCKVVPVFDRANWSGKKSYEAALEIWKRVTRGHYGTDKINALRRYLEKGTPDYEELERIAA